MSSSKPDYHAFVENDNESDDFENNVQEDSLNSSSDSPVQKIKILAQNTDIDRSDDNIGSFAASIAPLDTMSDQRKPKHRKSGSADSSSGGSNPLLNLTKKRKKPPLPKIESRGIVNYSADIGDNSDSESDTSTLSAASNAQGYALPFTMQSGYPNSNVDDDIDDDELSQRTPIPKTPPKSSTDVILPKDFLRNRTKSDTNMSDLSEDDSVVKRHQREQENVGRLVYTAKQQQSFAQLWFSAGITQNALPPIPPKKTKNQPSDAKKTAVVVKSAPIDMDTGEQWDGIDQAGIGTKNNWENGSFNPTAHSAPTKKQANKKKAEKLAHTGVPIDEDLTTYYVDNKCLDRIVCTIGNTRCSFLALLVVVIFSLFITGGSIAAGLYFTRSNAGMISPSSFPSAMPSISYSPSISISPSISPSDLPTMTPSYVPTLNPSVSPSTTPTASPSANPSSLPTSVPSPSPSLRPSKSPSRAPSSSPSIQPSQSIQPSSSPSSQPSTCFSSVKYNETERFPFSGGKIGDRNGYSVSLSEDGTVVAVSSVSSVSSSNNPFDLGSVTVYQQTIDSQWEPKGSTISREGNTIELSNDGNTLVIGGRSVTGVYRFNPNAAINDWVLLGENITEEDNSESELFVTISGDGNVIAIGDPKYDGEIGRVNTYTFNGTHWDQRREIIGSSAFFAENLGKSVSLSGNGNILACGVPFTSDPLSIFAPVGSVRVYRWDSNLLRWNLMGNEIFHDFADNFGEFGDAVSISDSETQPRIAIGAPLGDKGDFTDSGRVSVWQYGSDVFDGTFKEDKWFQIGDDIVGSPRDNQKFGQSISISQEGKHVAVGTPLYLQGQAFVQFWNGNYWDVAEKLNGQLLNEKFGYAVDLSGNGGIFAVGASSTFTKGYTKVFIQTKNC